MFELEHTPVEQNFFRLDTTTTYYMLKCPEIVTGKSPFAPISICSGNSKRKKKANTVTETHKKVDE